MPATNESSLPDLSGLTNAELRLRIRTPATTDNDFFAAVYESVRRHLAANGIQVVIGARPVVRS